MSISGPITSHAWCENGVIIAPFSQPPTVSDPADRSSETEEDQTTIATYRPLSAHRSPKDWAKSTDFQDA
jgi:hypothetical protein